MSIHTWENTFKLYQSLVSAQWLHVPAFIELLPAIKSHAQKLNLTPVTSHEQLLLSKYSDHPKFFDMEFIKVHPLPNDVLLLETYGQGNILESSNKYSYSESLPYIVSAMNKHLGSTNAL